jgi:hypothetical protein
MRDPILSTADIIRESTELVRVVKANAEATRRQITASRAVIEDCQRLLRKIQVATLVDDVSHADLTAVVTTVERDLRHARDTQAQGETLAGIDRRTIAQAPTD